MIGGAILIVIVLLVVGPLVWWATYAAMAFVLGLLLVDHAEAAHEGSDLVATNY